MTGSGRGRRDDRRGLDATAADGPPRGVAGLRETLHELVADITGVPAEQIDDARPLAEYGLTSRGAVALSGHLEQLLDCSLPATLLWEHPSIGQLVSALGGMDQPTTHEDEHEDVSGRNAAQSQQDDLAVAIVGIGCRLPGGIHGPDAFFEQLLAGTDAVGQVPQERWRDFCGGAPDFTALMERTTRWGAFVDGIDGFDADYFGITPREAEVMDPQQRLLLEVACEALDHAGTPAHSLKGTSTGVFVGLSAAEYGHLTTCDPTRLTPWTSAGAAASIAANRVSYLLDLHGPSMTVDTACSSSLVAVHLACRSLRSHDCETALAAGVNVLLSPSVTASFEQADALAADGRCKPFDAAADGITRGEGCAVVVLKRLADAERDGDNVLAVLRGSAVNQDGRSAGLMAPNPAAQEALLRAALRDARIEDTDLDYVETHGTGTLLGDPIEATALGAVAGHGRAPDRPLLIGSVKSNLGHLEGAAGIVGLIKTALALHHGRIPPSVHFHHPNPHIDFTALGLRVVTEPTPWPAHHHRPARAGVSAFGFGGTNAHAILEQAPTVLAPAARDQASATPHVLVVSARSRDRLPDAAASLSWLVADHDTPALTDIAHTLAHHRRGQTVAAVVARTGRQAAAQLAALARDERVPGLVPASSETPTAGGSTARRPVFVFSGYGSQWRGMGGRLLADDPLFAAEVSALDPLYRAQTGTSLTDMLTRPDSGEALDRTQPLLFGIQLALARTLQAYGVEPAAVVGHSMGEVAAAVVAGALDARDGLRVINCRSAHLAKIDAEHAGAMAAVEVDEASRETILGRFPGVEIAVHSSPQRCTVAGPAKAVHDLVNELTQQGHMARLLEVGGAGHCAAVDPVLAPLRRALAELRPRTPAIPWFSTVTDDPSAPTTADADYWCANVRRPVRLQQAVTAAADDGHDLFLEIAPHPIASVPVTETLGRAAAGRQCMVIPTLHKAADEAVDLRVALTKLHFAGVAMDTSRLWPHGARTALPTPQWRHERFWFARPVLPAAGGHRVLGLRTDDPRTGAVLWQADIGTRRHPLPNVVHNSPVLTLPVVAELVIEAALDVWAGAGLACLGIEDLKIHDWLALSTSTPVTVVWEPGCDQRAALTLHARGTDAAWRCYASAQLTPNPEALDEGVLERQGPALHLAPDDTESQHLSYADLLTAVLHAPAETAETAEPRTAPAGDPSSPAADQQVPIAVESLQITAQGVLDTSYDICCGPTDGTPGADRWDVTAHGPTTQIAARAVELRSIQRRDIPRPLEGFTYEIRWEKSPATLRTGLDRVFLVSGGTDADAALVASLTQALRAQQVDVVSAACDDSLDSALTAWLSAAPDGHSAVVALATQQESDGSAQALHTAARLARCLSLTQHQRPARLWMVTVMAQTTTSAERGTPHLACLRGLVRVLALEHPRLRASLVDIDTQPAAVEDLVQELLGGGHADEVAWRSGTRLAARLARADLSAQRGDQLVLARSDGAYIVTGGLTGLGLATARRLAEQGAGRLILNGRRPAGPEAQQVLAEVRARGTRVDVVRGDLADPDVAPHLVRAALAEGHLLRGVVHCAGVLHDRMIDDLEPGDIDIVWQPKVVGAQNLEAACAAHDLDWWVTYSSAAALLGSPGQAAYAAANAWLDSMAHRRRAQGLPATAIAWGPWDNIGDVRAGAAGVLEPLTMAEGLDALQALVTLDRAHTGVVHLDTGRVLAAFPGLADLPFFAGLVREDGSARDDWACPTGIAALEGAADKVYARLATRTAAVMGFTAHDLDENAALTDLGLDSLMTVRIRNAAMQDFGVDLPPTLLLRGASLRELADTVLRTLGLASPPPAPEPVAVASEQTQHTAPALPDTLGPRDAAERLVASTWAEVLHRRPRDVHEDFTDAGGDQLAAQALVELIHRRTNPQARPSLNAQSVISRGTVAAIADLIRPTVNRTGQPVLNTLRPAVPGSKRPALFTFHPAGGPTSVYIPLTQLLPSEQPVYGLERVDTLPTMQDKAAHYLTLIRDIQPEGPYHLLGWSFGGCLAFEVARQLRQAGEAAGFVGLIDTILPSALPEQASPQQLMKRFARFSEYVEKTYGRHLELPYDELAATPDDQQIDLVMRQVAEAGLDMSPGIMEHQRTSYIDARVGERYVPEPYDGHLVLYRARQPQQLTTALDPRYLRQETDLGWEPLCRSLEIVPVEGDHLSVIDPPHVQTIAQHLTKALRPR
ncbi:type I polyketide synthase [Streptacidiphilus anmyonensis]|uniref:type I polyketide synthase n=1 Tax=Streptacidiphilus anmyonensis TaxID=405782 RepID=UPI000693DFAA|nr:type I polyketide synthase [Streptacidiphilus anmyonensis]